MKGNCGFSSKKRGDLPFCTLVQQQILLVEIIVCFFFRTMMKWQPPERLLKGIFRIKVSSQIGECFLKLVKKIYYRKNS